MELGRRINEIRKEKGISIDELSSISGIPKSTLGKITAGFTANPTLDTVKAIARALGCRLDDFDDPQDRKTPYTLSLSEDALRLARHYEALDDHGRQVLLAVADVELERLSVPAADPAPRHKLIPLLGASFAAGKAEPDFGNMWEDFEVSADIPAEFAIRVHGDSMEPALPDGCIAFGVKRVPQDGEVGAFMLNGEYLCKQYCRDSQGNVYLFSLNRARSDLDISLMRGADPVEELYCFGTILTDRRYPLP